MTGCNNKKDSQEKELFKITLLNKEKKSLQLSMRRQIKELITELSKQNKKINEGMSWEQKNSNINILEKTIKKLTSELIKMNKTIKTIINNKLKHESYQSEMEGMTDLNNENTTISGLNKEFKEVVTKIACLPEEHNKVAEKVILVNKETKNLELSKSELNDKSKKKSSMETGKFGKREYGNSKSKKKYDNDNEKRS